MTGRAARRPRVPRVEAPQRREGIHVEARHGGAAILAVRQHAARWVWLSGDEIGPVAAELLALLPPDQARELLTVPCARLADRRPG
jgi:hypothetical protein